MNTILTAPPRTHPSAPRSCGFPLLALVLIPGLLLHSGCQSWGRKEPIPNMPRIHLEARQSQHSMAHVAMTDTVELPVSGTRISIFVQPSFAEHNLEWVDLYAVDRGLVLGFRLNAAGARELTRISVQNIGARLVLVVDGEALGARPIDRAIEQGVIYTFVEVDDGELPAMVEAFQAALAEHRKRRRWEKL